MTHKLYSKEDIAKVREALEADCGDRCNAEYNPCAAREALAILDAGKDANRATFRQCIRASDGYPGISIYATTDKEQS